MPIRNYMVIDMDLEDLFKDGIPEKETEIVLYFDKDHKAVDSEDDAIITEIFKFDDKGVIISLSIAFVLALTVEHIIPHMS